MQNMLPSIVAIMVPARHVQGEGVRSPAHPNSSTLSLIRFLSIQAGWQPDLRLCAHILYCHSLTRWLEFTLEQASFPVYTMQSQHGFVS